MMLGATYFTINELFRVTWDSKGNAVVMHKLPGDTREHVSKGLKTWAVRVPIWVDGGYREETER